MAAKRILLKGLYGLRDEGVATEAITPGHLVEHVTAGYQKHATAGGNVNVVVAMEREMVGDDIDTAYAASDTILLGWPQHGAVINMLVAASASAIALNDPLESAGNGAVRRHTPPSQAVAESGSASYTIAPKTNAIIGYAEEAKDNSGGGTAVRIMVRIN